MERFDIAKYIKENYRAEYPFQKGGYLPLDVNKIEHLINEVHEHYENQAPQVDEYKEPELVDDNYSFNPPKKAEVKELHSGDEKRQIVLRKFSEMIKGTSYVLAYEDDDGVNYAIGGGVKTKDLLYLQYVLNYQIAIELQKGSMGV